MSRRHAALEYSDEEVKWMEEAGGVKTCVHCGSTDYYRNPGPWLFYPRFGWFCCFLCLRAHIAREHADLAFADYVSVLKAVVKHVLAMEEQK